MTENQVGIAVGILNLLGYKYNEKSFGALETENNELYKKLITESKNFTTRFRRSSPPDRCFYFSHKKEKIKIKPFLDERNVRLLKKPLKIERVKSLCEKHKIPLNKPIDERIYQLIRGNHLKTWKKPLQNIKSFENIDMTHCVILQKKSKKALFCATTGTNPTLFNGLRSHINVREDHSVRNIDYYIKKATEKITAFHRSVCSLAGDKKRKREEKEEKDEATSAKRPKLPENKFREDYEWVQSYQFEC